MKVLLRINYAILAVVFLYIAFTQAFIMRRNKFYEIKGNEVLNSDSVDKYMFFYEAKGIHQNQPLFAFSNDKIKISFYEISTIDYQAKDNVITYLYPIITETDETFGLKKETYVLNFKRNMPGEKSVYPFEIVRYLNLDFFDVDTGFDEGLPMITGDEEVDLITKRIVGLEIFRENKEIEKDNGDHFIYLNVSFNFNDGSFPIRNELINLFNQKRLANEELKITEEDKHFLETNKQIIFQKFHDASEFNYILLWWLGGYAVLFVVATYLVFFFRPKRKYLGRKKPSEGLKKSIEAKKKTDSKTKNTLD